MCVFNLFNLLNIGCGKIGYDSQVAKLKVFSLCMLFLPFSVHNLNRNRWLLQQYLAIFLQKKYVSFTKMNWMIYYANNQSLKNKAGKIKPCLLLNDQLYLLIFLVSHMIIIWNNNHIPKKWGKKECIIIFYIVYLIHLLLCNNSLTSFS